MKKVLTYFFILWSVYAGFSQLEASHWYFGHLAGLDFNYNPVMAVRGQLDTEEGCSSISDRNGNLLMYTDGITIYDHNHVIMPNGRNLSGHPSSSQSGLIVPRPLHPNLYYVFSISDANSDRELRYSLVDMNLRNGAGDVVSMEKNILLIENAAEKVSAVANLSQNFVWVVTFAPAPRTNSLNIPVRTYNSPSNTIYAIKVDQSGIVSQVVQTRTNISISPSNTHGYLKLSPRGDKLVLANYYDESLYLLDFDINTGHTSNQVTMPIPSGFMPYGAEFSPSGDILYVKGTNNSSSQAYILQYDLTTTPYHYNIIASQTGYRGALQLAIDGKIYVAESESYSTGRPFLSTINNPDVLGAGCNFQYHSVNTANNSLSRQGLPQFIQTFFVQIQTDNVCVDEPAHFQVSSNVNIGSVNWDFGDGATATTPPVTGNPQVAETDHTYSNAGIYTVTAEIITVNNDTTHIQTNIEIYPLPIVDSIPNIEACDTAQTGLITLNLHQYDSNITLRQTYQGTYAVSYYTSQQDAEAETNEISDPFTTTTPYDQEIWASVVNTTTGCSNVGSFHIIVHPLPDIYTIPELEVCDEDDDGLAEFTLENAMDDILNGRNPANYTVTFYATQADAESQTNPISSPYTNTTPHQQTVYYVITDNETGCSNVGSFDLVVHPKPEINMDDEYIVCEGDSIYVEAPGGFVSYYWTTGDTTQGIYIYNGGDYTVTVTDQFGCSNDKTIHVTQSGPATIDHIETVDFNGHDNSITVYVSGNGDYEYSLDDVNYQDSNTFTGLYPGTYTVYVRDKNGCGKVEAEVDLLGAPPYFSPNGDGTHEYWQVINVHRAPGTTIYVYNRYGLLMKQFTDADPGWDGTFNGVQQPSDDYWFVVELPSGRIVKGHFSLIR